MKFLNTYNDYQSNSAMANDKPSFRVEPAAAFSFRFAPANRSAGGGRNLSSILTPGNVSKSLLAFSVVVFSLSAQAPTAVPVAQEPSHHKVFENSYVRVFRVTIPANQKSLLHRHDLDYLYVSLGPADIINAVQGKPELHPKLEDGHVGFAKGGFAHVATAVGMPFNNVTIELLKPQGEPRNLCDEVVPGGAGPCMKENRIGKFMIVPSFETDGIKVYSYALQPKVSLEDVPEADVLLVALDQAQLGIQVTGTPDVALTGGTTTWVPRKRSLIIQNTGDHPSRFLSIKFKDATAKLGN